jgi:phosphatidylinositol alpha-1,6-mannosyltransferase
MKLLYLTPGCFDKGGISRYSRYQIAALREICGDENVRTLSLLGPDKQSFETPFNVDWYAGGNALAQKVSFAAKVFQLALVQRPDVLWTAHVSFSALVRIAAAMAGAKTVVNEYGLEAWSDLGWDTAWGLKGMTEVVSDCHFTAEWMEEAGKRPRGSIHVVWDCVDIERFSPRPPSRGVLEKYGIPDPATGVNILSLGRLSRDAAHKGYDRLLEAFSRAAGRVPSARLIFAGKGDLVSELAARAKVLGLEGRVFFTGMVHEDDLADVYRSAHVFSLVSDRGEGRGEGIPLTPLEAASCGVPILVGNQDGSQEAVVEGLNGHILDPFDLDAHADVLLRLSRDQETRKRMGEAARKRIEEEFAYPIFREKHRALLQKWFPSAKINKETQ